MNALTAHDALATETIPLNGTRAASDSELASPTVSEGCKRGWGKVIDDYLIEWGKDPSILADEGLVPPSKEIIHLACQWAKDRCESGWSPPVRVVPDGEGGICFENQVRSCFQSLNIRADRTVELLTFEDCRLVAREKLL
jgi:hypothetical protein